MASIVENDNDEHVRVLDVNSDEEVRKRFNEKQRGKKKPNRS